MSRAHSHSSSLSSSHSLCSSREGSLGRALLVTKASRAPLFSTARPSLLKEKNILCHLFFQVQHLWILQLLGK